MAKRMGGPHTAGGATGKPPWNAPPTVPLCDMGAKYGGTDTDSPPQAGASQPRKLEIVVAGAGPMFTFVQIQTPVTMQPQSQ